MASRSPVRRVCLAYSGGLDTSVILKWLTERYGCENRWRAAIDESQRNVTGEARVKLFKGSAMVTGRRSPVSLYSESTVTFEDSATEYRQSDATSFIRIVGGRLAPRRD